MNKIKVCKNCGVSYYENMRSHKEDAIEFDGYGRILCFSCRHDERVNYLGNEKLK